VGVVILGWICPKINGLLLTTKAVVAFHKRKKYNEKLVGGLLVGGRLDDGLYKVWITNIIQIEVESAVCDAGVF